MGSTTTTVKPAIKIIVRNSQNNQPVTNATGTVSLHQNEGLVTVAQDANFDSAGKLTLSVHSLGRYIIEIEASGFITHTLEVTVACTSPDCVLEKMVVMSPTLPPGQTRIMMAWDAKPLDVDIHVMAIKRSDNSLCRTWYQHKTGCASIHQDLDNTKGGLNGAETVTLLNNTVNIQYTYLIAVEDYAFENQGAMFLNSGTGITVTNGLQTVEREMKATEIKQETEFYLFGCLDVEAGGHFTVRAAPDGTFFNGDDKEAWKTVMAANCQ